MEITSNFSNIWFSILALAGGILLLVAGGETLISGAVKLAGRLGMSSLLIGLTVVAFGTSMPELFVSLNATLQNHPDIMIGNVIGSNIANIGLVLALSALLSPLAIHFSRIAKELYLVLLASLLLFGITWTGVFNRIFGLLFVAAIIAYTVSSYHREVREKKNNEAPRKEASDSHAYTSIISFIIAGLLLLAFGSTLFINGAVDVARHFGVSELVIGLTLAAVGTSLPELASCISAIRRRESDILVGNIVGSNLFNLLLVMGGTAIVVPFDLPSHLLRRDLPAMLLFSAFLVPVLYRTHRLQRHHGAILLTGYIIYLYLLI